MSKAARRGGFFVICGRWFFGCVVRIDHAGANNYNNGNT